MAVEIYLSWHQKLSSPVQNLEIWPEAAAEILESLFPN
jgi:hypothetical protein